MTCIHLPCKRQHGFALTCPDRCQPACRYVPELDRIVLKDVMSSRPFASSATCRKAVITARILGLVHELCLKGIHVTKRDLFYTDVKLFEVWRPQLRQRARVHGKLGTPAVP